MRPWKAEDRSAFAELNKDPQVMEFFPSALTQRESDAFADRITKHLLETGWGLWATERTDTKEFIGYVGLARPTFEAAFAPCVEIGWRLKTDSWGKGFATEAAKEVLRFGFEELALEEIVSFTSKINIRSIKVMERIGMKLDGDGEFDHPRLEQDHPLARHVLYRIRKGRTSHS